VFIASVLAGFWWLTPVILTTQETEIRRIKVQSQPRQIVHKTLSWKIHITKKGWWSGSRCRPRVQTPIQQQQKYCVIHSKIAKGVEFWMFSPQRNGKQDLVFFKKWYILEIILFQNILFIICQSIYHISLKLEHTLFSVLRSTKYFFEKWKNYISFYFHLSFSLTEFWLQINFIKIYSVQKCIEPLYML
jgi:hypothetical protein